MTDTDTTTGRTLARPENLANTLRDALSLLEAYTSPTIFTNVSTDTQARATIREGRALLKAWDDAVAAHQATWEELHAVHPEPVDLRGVPLPVTDEAALADDEAFLDEVTSPEETPPEPAFYCVSIYLVDRQFGGHEEGGWYYTYGDPALEHGGHTACFIALDAARNYRRHLEANVLPGLNEGRPDIYSVLSQGRYEARIDEGEYPAHFPKERQHYE